MLEVTGVHWASSKNVTEAVLGRRPGVLAVDANPVAQTATVTYDPATTDLTELRDWVRECGYHCAGQSVPQHVCDPMADPHADDRHGGGHLPPTAAGTPARRSRRPSGRRGPCAPRRRTAPVTSPHEAMGHGGHGAMSMADMVRDMRNRFLVAALFSVPDPAVVADRP